MHKASRRDSGLHAVRTPGPLPGPVGIVRDLPVNFWHPAMGVTGEEVVGEEEKELQGQPPTWASKAFGCWVAAMLVGVGTLGFIWFAAKVIENL